MKINRIIKEKRKEFEMTQEQIADLLGVSASAVNKWEKGSSYPDITILPPLARLLKVDLNTLLSFQEDLTEKEIANLSNDIVNTIKEDGYDIGFQLAMQKLKEYPNSDKLVASLALTLEGALIMFGIDTKENYEERIETLYERASKSEDQDIRNQATSMLISKYTNRKEYEKAEALLTNLTDIPMFDKKVIEANILMNQQKYPEAAQILEHKLLTMTTDIHSTLLKLMDIANEEGRKEDAALYADTAKKTAINFDMWEYTSYIAEFQLSVINQNTKQCLELINLMLSSMKKKWNINSSPFYRHMKVKPDSDSIGEQMLPGVIHDLEKDEKLDFLRADERFQELINHWKES